jgi:hypothetical protein
MAQADRAADHADDAALAVMTPGPDSSKTRYSEPQPTTPFSPCCSLRAMIQSWVGRTLRACALTLYATCGVTSLSTPALGQTDEERAGARAAATEGANAFSEGRYADAIDLFSRAESIIHAPPHLLYIARAQEKLGKLVKAREVYLKLTRETLAPGAPKQFRDAQEAAQKELAALEPRLPYVSVVVQGAGPLPVTVTMDGLKVPQALVGVPRPVDPGEHRFQAFAEGMETNLSSVTVREGARETVVLTLQQASATSPAPGTETVATTAPASASNTGEPPADSASTSSGTNGMRIGSYAALGVGVVGLAVGTIFTLQAAGKRSDWEELCTGPGGACPPEKKDEISGLRDDEKSASTIGMVGFIVGGVGIATGVTLFLLSGSSDSSKTAGAPRLRPWLGVGSAGLDGTF